MVGIALNNRSLSGFGVRKNKKIEWKFLRGEYLCCACSLTKGISPDSKPTTPVRCAKPVEPNPSHLRETLVVGVEVIAQVGRRVESAHVHDGDFLPGVGALGDNT